MVESTDPMVSWTLVAGLGASVAWLASHGWRQGRRLRRWADRQGLPVAPDGEARSAAREELAQFDRDSCHLRRKLREVREVVRAGDVSLVRCSETLDFLPWRSGSGPAKTRIVVLFPAPPELDTYSIVGRDGAPSREISPGVRFADSAANRRICGRLPGPPPGPLSVTLCEGQGMAYLLSASGSVTDEALDYLRDLGRTLATELGRAGRGSPDEAAGVVAVPTGGPPREGTPVPDDVEEGGDGASGQGPGVRAPEATRRVG